MEFTGERMIPEFNQGQGIYLEHMTRYMFASQFVKDKVVLDIACGSGYGSDYLLKAGAKKVVGVDISEETINYCKEKYSNNNIEFLVGSVEKIPVEDNSVDIIVSFETIEHVDEKAQVNFLQEVKRVLKPEGIFVVSTPNSLIYPKGNEFHLKELNPEEFESILKKNFKNVEMFYQDDIECSYVYSRKNLENMNDDSGVSKKTDAIQAMDSRYLIAVCENIHTVEIKEYLGLSKIKIHDIQNYFVRKIERRDLVIQQKDKEIEFIKSSKFWKLREWNFKIKFLIFHPVKFTKKYWTKLVTSRIKNFEKISFKAFLILWKDGIEKKGNCVKIVMNIKNKIKDNLMSKEEQLKKNFTFDQYGRYAIIRDTINHNRKDSKKFKVLDVGGRGNILKKFLPDDDVFYLDPLFESEDKNFIKGDGCAMELKSESFDWVVSADVFEHIPKEKRNVFLEENIRVARLGIILAAPFYSPAVEKAEINVNECYKMLSGKDYVWLREHVNNGLPTEKDTEEYISQKNYTFQKISNNNLLLWEPSISVILNAAMFNADDIKKNIQEFNYFYNSQVFPFDFSEPSYRKIYFIKKKAYLRDLDVSNRVIGRDLLLKVTENINKLSSKAYATTKLI